MLKMKRYCQCGCREKAREGNRFINGHNKITHTEEFKRKISERQTGENNVAKRADVREKIKKAKLGSKWSEERKRNNILSTPEIRKKAVNTTRQRYGKSMVKNPKEKAKKCSIAMKGKNKGKNCSEETRRKLSLASKGNKSFSGHKHTNQEYLNKMKDRKGIKNPHWKNGPERYRIRMSNEYKQWRTLVFERDNYTCQTCSKRGGITLNADHIVPFSECLDINFKNLIFDMDNGQTLCVPCHRETDTYGGGSKC